MRHIGVYKPTTANHLYFILFYTLTWMKTQSRDIKLVHLNELYAVIKLPLRPVVWPHTDRYNSARD